MPGLSIAKISDAEYYLTSHGPETAAKRLRYYTSEPSRVCTDADGELKTPGVVAFNTFRTGTRPGQEVDPGWFRAGVSGHSPDDGRRLIGKSGNGSAVQAFDFTFSAERSVSILMAQSPELRDRLIAIQQEVITTILRDHLEPHFAAGRIGAQGAGGRIQGQFMAGTLFTHLSSRPTIANADGSVVTDPEVLVDGRGISKRLSSGTLQVRVGDPNLHTHVVVPNAIRCTDGKIRSIDASRFLKQGSPERQLIEEAYHTELVARLRREGLGVSVSADGSYRVEGVSEEVRRHFSRRAAQLEALGIDEVSPKGRQVLKVASRLAKAHASNIDAERVWRDDLAQFGVHPVQFKDLPPPSFDDGIQAVKFELDELFSQEAAHDQPAVLAAIMRGARKVQLPATDAVAIYRHLVIRGELIEAEPDGSLMVTSRHQLESERELLAIGTRMANSTSHPPTEAAVVAVRSKLEQDPRTRAEQLAAFDKGVGPAAFEIIEGTAGSGKSFVLGQIARAHAGYQVHDVALAWRAANDMKSQAGGESRAIAKFLADLRTGRLKLHSKSLILLDEVGQVNVSDLLAVLKAAEGAGAKVIATGDQLQTKAIGAGDALRLLAAEIGSMRLDQSVRMKDLEDRQTAEDLSRGNADAALNRMASRSQVGWAFGAKRLKELISREYLEYMTQTPGKRAMIIVRTRKEVRELTSTLRQAARAHGLIGGDEWIYDNPIPDSGVRIQSPVPPRTEPIEISAGDRLRFSGKEHLISADGTPFTTYNGVTGSVLAVGPGGLDLRIDDSDVMVRFHPAALTHGVRHAWVDTAYGSQGATVDKAFVAVFNGGRGWARDLAFVACSRARYGTRLLFDARALEAATRKQGEKVSQATLVAGLAKKLARVTSKISALDLIAVSGPKPVERPTAPPIHVPNMDRAASGLAALVRRLRARLCKPFGNNLAGTSILSP